MARQVGQERRSFSGWLLALSVAVFGCSTTTGPTVTNPPRAGFCVYPQGCYVLACDCQSGPNACRVLTAGGGAVGAQGTPPQYSDPAVDCQGADRACLLPEQVCVAETVTPHGGELQFAVCREGKCVFVRQCSNENINQRGRNHCCVQCLE